MGEALLLPLAFVCFGLAFAQLSAESGARGSHDPDQALYPAEMVPADPAPQLWLVDGFNVVSVGLLRDRGAERSGWWRREHREALVRLADAFDDPAAELWLVFDGRDPAGDGRAGRTRTVFAASADEWLVRRVRAAPAPGELSVVTADRRLANRVRSVGAQVVSPGDFLSRCLV